jgi:hypothetical protein
MRWQVESYPDPQLDGVLDGKDADKFEDLGGRDELKGRVQKFWRRPFVSDFADEVSDVAGLGGGGPGQGQGQEFKGKLKKGMTMISRDLESRFLAFAKEAQEDNGTLPNETRSLGVWAQNTAQTLYPVPAAYRPAAAQNNTTAVGSLVEADIRAVMKSCAAAAKGKVDMDMICGSDLKEQISTFQSFASASNATRQLQMKAGELEQAVDVFKNDFGTLRVLLSYFVAKDTAYSAKRGYIVDTDMLELRYNRMPRIVQLENKGGGPRAIIDAIVGLVCKNPVTMASFGATA